MFSILKKICITNMRKYYFKMKPKIQKFTNQACKLNSDFLYIQIITGMYLFKIKKVNGKYLMRKRKRLWPTLLYFALTLFLMIYCTYVVVSSLNQEDMAEYYAWLINFSVTTVVAIFSVMLFNYKYEVYVELLQKVTDIEDELTALGKPVTYIKWYFLMGFYGCGYILFILSSINFIRIVGLYRLLNYYWSYVHANTIRIMGFILPLIVGRVGSTLFKLLNECLEELEESCNFNDDNDREKPRFILIKISELHAQLIYLLNLYTDSVSYITLINVFLNIFQLVFGISYLIYDTKNTLGLPKDVLVSFIVHLNIQMGVLGFFNYRLEQEVKNSFLTLGQLNIFYFDSNTALLKNTFLLQGMHIKINIVAGHWHPINLSVFIKQINMYTTLMLLLQPYYITYANSRKN